jgi:hypothetical protein
VNYINSTLNTSEIIRSIELTTDNKYVVVAFGIGGIHIFDISADVENPVFVSNITVGFDIFHIDL